MEQAAPKVLRLKALRANEFTDALDRELMQRYSYVWDDLLAGHEKAIASLATSIYFKVLDMYVATRRPTMMSLLSQQFSKQWMRTAKAAEQEHMKLIELIQCLIASKTLPLSVHTLATGATVFLPTSIFSAVFNRERRKETTADFWDIFDCKQPGPPLRDDEVRIAYNALWPEPASDENGHSAQKIDDAPQPAVFPTETPVEYPGDTGSVK